ncbi:hypothetical protein RUND412_000978 [Rhizina undulata]
MHFGMHWWTEKLVVAGSALCSEMGLGLIIPSPAWEPLSPVTSELPVEDSAGENVATEVSEELMEIDSEDIIQATADIVPDNVSEIFFSQEESQMDMEANEMVSITTESAYHEGNPTMASSLTENAAANIFADDEESVNAPVSTDWYQHAPPIIQQPESLTLPEIQELLPSASQEQRMKASPIGTISDFQLPNLSPSDQPLREANPVTSSSAHSGPTVQQPQLDMEVLAQQPAVEYNTLLITASQANASTDINNTRISVQATAEAIFAIIRGSGMVPPSVRSPLVESLNVDEPAPMALMAQEQQVPKLLTITQPPGPISSGANQPLLGRGTEKQSEERGTDSSSPSSSMDDQNQSSKKRKAETQLSNARVLKTAKLDFPEQEAAISSSSLINLIQTVTARTHGYNLRPRPTLQPRTPMRKSIKKSRTSARNIPTRESTSTTNNRKRSLLAVPGPRFRCIMSGCDKNYSLKNIVRRHVRQHHREVQWDLEAVQRV